MRFVRLKKYTNEKVQNINEYNIKPMKICYENYRKAKP